MTIGETLDGRSLLVLLQTALAVGGVGCSTTDDRVVSYPWRAAEHRLVLGEPVDADTCRKICVRNHVTWRAGLGHLTTDACQLTRIEMSRPVGRDPEDPITQVACLARGASTPLPYRDEASYFRPLPNRLVGLAREGRLMSLDRQTCRQICLPPDPRGGEPTVFEDFCTIFPIIPARPMPPDSVFVECDYSNGRIESFDTKHDKTPPPDPRYQGSPDWLHLPAGRILPGTPGFQRPARSVAEFGLQAAHAEAQSVIAFELLALQLRAHGAPAAWPRRARAFARDEARHARAWLGIVERGTHVSLDSPAAPRPRSPESLAQLAIDNVVSGCIGETHGAWLLLRQAVRARESRLQLLAERIARDEAEHAAFAFEIHAWLWPRLSDAERNAVISAAAVAVLDMHRPLPATPAVAEAVGLPNNDVMAREQAPLVQALQGWLS